MQVAYLQGFSLMVSGPVSSLATLEARVNRQELRTAIGVRKIL
jgi:hypothetical protein